jgi:hypothetical protein
VLLVRRERGSRKVTPNRLDLGVSIVLIVEFAILILLVWSFGRGTGDFCLRMKSLHFEPVAKTAGFWLFCLFAFDASKRRRRALSIELES